METTDVAAARAAEGMTQPVLAATAEKGVAQGENVTEADCDSIDPHNKEEDATRKLKRGVASIGAGATMDYAPAESDSDILVVVTGGSKGIGKACVESFAKRGARVLFTYCSDHDSAARVEMSFQPPGRVQCRHLDQGNFHDVRAFAAEVNAWRNGRQLNALINNAALGVATVRNYKGLQQQQSEQQSDKKEDKGNDIDEAYRRAEEDMALMRVNALGPMWLTEALLPMMTPLPRPPPQPQVRDDSHNDGENMSARKKKARIREEGTKLAPTASGSASRSAAVPVAGKQTVLFIGSVGGASQSVFPAFRAADAMSKAALAYACRHFAARRRPRHKSSSSSSSSGGDGSENDVTSTVGRTEIDAAVDFVCLSPGATLTDMFKASTLDKMSEMEREKFVRALPQGRLIQPEEVGEAVYWMCSSLAASMFHGAVVDASAGLAVRPGALTEYAF